MATDTVVFDMLAPDELNQFSRERLEAEMLRVHAMLDAVTDYQRLVVSALKKIESLTG